MLGEPVPLPAEPRGLSVHPSGQWVGLYDAQAHLIEVNVATRAVRILDTQSFTNKAAPSHGALTARTARC